MDKPTEIEFKGLLFGGILVMLLLAITLIVFFVIYQKKILAQQIYLQQIQNDYQKNLLTSSIEAQEKERERIARDLHDEIGSALSTAKLFVSQLQLSNQGAEHKQLTGQVKEILVTTLQEVRNISHDLMPDVLKKFGLVEALRNLVDVFSEASGMKVQCQIDATPNLPYQHELALYRVVQELTHNALKHAKATHLKIRLWQEDHLLKLSVEDNGKGFDWQATKTSKEAGIGLKSIEARVSMLEGKLLVDASPNQGTRMHIEINLGSLIPDTRIESHG